MLRWADLIAARNAAQALLVVLKDPEVDLDATRLAVGWQVRDWLPTAVAQGPDPVLDDREQAIAWLEDLVQRLWKSMPC